ncbi:MAG TPA: AAA family ATPase, partial [Anaerolineales bacterium]|nr:AAA family ATPase [Anaerolineales bacterium]
DEEFLEFVARGTRANQLFLTESIDREVAYFEEVYNWFDNLVIIYPETRHQMDLNINNEKTIEMVKYLERAGTGVCGFGLQSISIETEFPQALIEDVTKELKPNDQTILMNNTDGQRYLISRTPSGELVTEKFMLKHRMMDCNDEVLFDTQEESDGTIRLMDILPIVTTPDSSPKVYLIDELDRSLHPNLCHQLIKDFLEIQNNGQLIVTTHESNLLNLELLRRDEIWFVEKNKQGATAVYSLEEFTPRYDKDVQKGYLLGRFGAIPLMGKKSF